MNTSVLTRLCGLACLVISARIDAASDSIVIYPSLTATNNFLIEGRITIQRSLSEPSADDSRRRNMRRSLDLMINDERKLYPVVVRFGSREWPAKTDREGYFRVEANGLDDLDYGWHSVSAQTENGLGHGEILKVHPDNTHGVISDVDDTILITEVNSKRRMLSNTFFYNVTQREVVPGVVDFYKHLAQSNPYPQSAPVQYLSASPRQLHNNIEAFLARNDFPRGVLITKRVTDDRTSEPIINQVAYKTKRIEGMLIALPQVRFTLIGDDGERDPEIYADIQRRFPERIEAIWIRRVNPDPKRARFVGQGVLNDVLGQPVTQ